MVIVRPSRKLELSFISICIILLATTPALAQQGSVLTTLENSVVTAAKGWETTGMSAARSLFWILAGIEIGIAAVWLAINAASLDSWFTELVRRIMFIGLFAFILDQGPSFAKAVVDSLYQIGAGGGSAYTASKHGVIGLTRQMTFEYGARGIRINAICPGATATPMAMPEHTTSNSPDMDLAISKVPARRWCKPEEIARLAAFLGSDDADYVHGSAYVMDGGWLTAARDPF